MTDTPELPADVLNRLHARLRERAAALREDLAQAARVVQTADSEVFDRKDEAAAQVRSILADAETERDRAELALVEAALERLAHGGYGECIDCGEAILPARLQAQPAAPRCADCQQLAEHAASLRRAH